MDMSGETVCTGHFTAREKSVVFFELEKVGAGAALYVLEKRDFACCCCQDFNPKSSSVYHSHCACAAPYLFEDSTKVHINEMGHLDWMCFDSLQEFFS